MSKTATTTRRRNRCGPRCSSAAAAPAGPTSAPCARSTAWCSPSPWNKNSVSQGTARGSELGAARARNVDLLTHRVATSLTATTTSRCRTIAPPRIISSKRSPKRYNAIPATSARSHPPDLSRWCYAALGRVDEAQKLYATALAEVKQAEKERRTLTGTVEERYGMASSWPDATRGREDAEGGLCRPARDHRRRRPDRRSAHLPRLAGTAGGAYP